jgi:hypothetical protein
VLKVVIAFAWSDVSINFIFAVLWISERTGTIKMTIPPHSFQTHTTMLAHEWWVRDARTDARPDSPGRHKLLDTTILKKWKIVSDTKRQYKIPLRKCFDLSGHCEYWRQTRQCDRNPKFMAETCPLTCKLCESDYREDDDDDSNEKTSQFTSGSSNNQDEHTDKNGNDEL